MIRRWIGSSSPRTGMRLPGPVRAGRQPCPGMRIVGELGGLVWGSLGAFLLYVFLMWVMSTRAGGAIVLLAALPVLTIVPIPGPAYSQVVLETYCGAGCPYSFNYSADQAATWPSGVQMTLSWSSSHAVDFEVRGSGAYFYDRGTTYDGPMCLTPYGGPASSGTCQFITGPNDRIEVSNPFGSNTGAATVTLTGSYVGPLLGYHLDNPP